VASHERNRASLYEIQELWSLEDLAEAHLAIDVHEELQRKVSTEQQRRIDAQKRKR